MFLRNLLHRARTVVTLFLVFAAAFGIPGMVNSQVLSIAAVQEQFKPEPSALRQAISTGERFSPFVSQQYSPLLERALQFQELGEHEAALESLQKALQICRINHGLYHEAQIPVLDSIIYNEMETSDWQSVDELYDYMTHLYKRLYADDERRLEEGLSRISSFHINAFNINLDGHQEYHLRKAAALLEQRLELAEQTLEEGHPTLAYLYESVDLSRKHLYLLSDRYKRLLLRKAEAQREILFAELD